MLGGTPLVELNKIGLTRQPTALPQETNENLNEVDVDNDLLLKEDVEDKTEVDLNEEDDNLNMDYLGMHEVDELANNVIFEEDKEREVVDEITLPLEQQINQLRKLRRTVELDLIESFVNIDLNNISGTSLLYVAVDDNEKDVSNFK